MKRFATFLALPLLAGLTAGAAQPTQAASTVVSVSVAASTVLDVTGCASAQANRTEFGTVLPGSARVTSLDCVVRFGSNNAPSTLQLSQPDALGPAMYAPTDGSRDVGFSGDGVFSTAVGGGSNADSLNVGVVTSDGKHVMVGTCDMGATALDVCVVRTDATGTLDPTFDGDGIRTLAIGPGASLDYGTTIAEVAGGKLLIASQCYSGATGLDHCLVRLLPSGALDPSFGSGGIELRDFTANHDFVRGLHVLANGSFLIAGDCEVGGPAGRRQCVARYLANGALDTAFGVGGLATRLPGGVGPVHDTQLLITRDGSIVLGSACYIGVATDFDFCLTRFGSDGSLDTSFGTGGSTITATSTGYDPIGQLVELDGGGLLAGGSCAGGGPTGVDTCFARYANDGTLDLAFGSSGISRIAPSSGAGSDYFSHMVHDGTSAFLAIVTCNSVATGDDICVSRLDRDGVLDTTFGSGGVATHPVAAGAGVDIARHATALGDGRILITGGCDMPAAGRDACALVLDSAGSISQYQPGMADWSTPDTGHFATCLLASGTSTAIWPTSASCPASNGTFWKAVPTDREGVATAASGTTNASANLRFGLRVAPSQAPGSYIAPINFAVVSP